MEDKSSIKTAELVAANIDAPIYPVDTQSNLNQEHLGRKSMSTEWTDEKHSLYIKSMETSFVKDLYNSFNSLGYKIEHPLYPTLSRRKRTTSSEQFKVLRRGCLEKINFERNRSRLIKFKKLGNPQFRHFRSSCGHQIIVSSTLHKKVVLAADLSRYESAEVTDQNFVDEEDTREKTSHRRNIKGIKIENSISPTSTNDQVVP